MMQFHPSKCQVLQITKKREPTKADYTIHNHKLDLVPEAKYLGVTFSNNMSWQKHIDITTKKAHNTLGFLRRNMGRCPSNIKAQCYKTLIRPQAKFASCIWDPYLKGSIKQVENVQRQSARFVKSDYSRESSVTSMLTNLQWESLSARRSNAGLVMAYRQCPDKTS